MRPAVGLGAIPTRTGCGLGPPPRRCPHSGAGEGLDAGDEGVVEETLCDEEGDGLVQGTGASSQALRGMESSGSRHETMQNISKQTLAKRANQRAQARTSRAMNWDRVCRTAMRRCVKCDGGGQAWSSSGRAEGTSTARSGRPWRHRDEEAFSHKETTQRCYSGRDVPGR